MSDFFDFTVTDEDGDTLSVQRAEGDIRYEGGIYVYAPDIGAYATRDQAIELYKALGEYLEVGEFAKDEGDEETMKDCPEEECDPVAPFRPGGDIWKRDILSGKFDLPDGRSITINNYYYGSPQ